MKNIKLRFKIIIVLFLASALIFVGVLVARYYCLVSYQRTSNLFISDTILNVITKSSLKNHNKIISEIITEIEKNDKILNPYNPESEISVVNRYVLEGQKEIELSEELAHLFLLGIEAGEQTDGKYSIGVKALIKLWGFGYRKPSVPNANEIAKVLKENTGTYDVSVLKKDGKYILTLKRPVTFDLGSYGKGYILEKMKTIFEKYGVKNYLVDYGGDVLIEGISGRGKPWVIGVQNPRFNEEGKEAIMNIHATNGSIVTSGDYERFFFENGKRYHHIFDATSGMSATNCVSLTIYHKNALAADMLSTIGFLYGTNFLTNDMFDYNECYIVTENPLSGEIFLYGKTNY